METTKNKGRTHVAFSTAQPSQVRSFYDSAISAGGQPHGKHYPAFRDEEAGHYSAAVLDLDGNTIEVVARCACNQDSMPSHFKDHSGKSVVPSARSKEDSRVLGWQKDVAESLADNATEAAPASRSVAPVSDVHTRRDAAVPPVVVVEEEARPAPNHRNGDVSTKAMIGTLVGAAGGAAVAYAMMKSESQEGQAKPARSGAAAPPAPIRRSRVFEPPLRPKTSSRKSSPTTVRRALPSKAPSTTQRRGIRAIEAPPRSRADRPLSTLMNTFVPTNSSAAARGKIAPFRSRQTTSDQA
ncbi:MAG: hypothetical protein M1837_006242 [Sclerophora amabilis]|nr:MAG: hypothetical protein M1837_006242 [Sclerophora amabilis]